MFCTYRRSLVLILTIGILIAASTMGRAAGFDALQAGLRWQGVSNSIYSYRIDVKSFSQSASRLKKSTFSDVENFLKNEEGKAAESLAEGLIRSFSVKGQESKTLWTSKTLIAKGNMKAERGVFELSSDGLDVLVKRPLDPNRGISQIEVSDLLSSTTALKELTSLWHELTDEIWTGETVVVSDGPQSYFVTTRSFGDTTRSVHHSSSGKIYYIGMSKDGVLTRSIWQRGEIHTHVGAAIPVLVVDARFRQEQLSSLAVTLLTNADFNLPIADDDLNIAAAAGDILVDNRNAEHTISTLNAGTDNVRKAIVPILRPERKQYSVKARVIFVVGSLALLLMCYSAWRYRIRK